MIDRIYTFNLSYNTVIRDADSKIVIRFPNDFQDQFLVTRCDAISGFNQAANGQGQLDCQYSSSVRILSIYLQEPVDQTLTELKFTVSGVTNPRVAATTGFFTVTSYERKQGSWSALETSDGSLRMKFNPGALSATSLDLSESEVGAYSDLTVQFQTEHAIPIQNGQIRVGFPKWNPNAPIDKYQSYVDTGTASVAVPCLAQQLGPADSKDDA